MNLDSLSGELDRLYQFEISEYISRCEELKKSGYKIYRDSTGQHKVVRAGGQVRNEQEQYVYEGNGRRARHTSNNRSGKPNILVRAKNRIVRGVETTRQVAKLFKLIYNSQKNR